VIGRVTKINSYKYIGTVQVALKQVFQK